MVASILVSSAMLNDSTSVEVIDGLDEVATALSVSALTTAAAVVVAEEAAVGADTDAERGLATATGAT